MCQKVAELSRTVAMLVKAGQEKDAQLHNVANQLKQQQERNVSVKNEYLTKLSVAAEQSNFDAKQRSQLQTLNSYYESELQIKVDDSARKEAGRRKELDDVEQRNKQLISCNESLAHRLEQVNK